MFFSFKKSPQELLEEKYLELIETNWVDKIQINPPWFNYYDKTYYSGVIRWVKWVWILVYQEAHEDWTYDSYGWWHKISYSYWWSVWKIESAYLAEKVYKIIDRLYQEERDKIRQENERRKQEVEEERQQAKDIEIIEVGRDFEQEARINKTRIASQKRKLNKAKNDNKKPNK